MATSSKDDGITASVVWVDCMAMFQDMSGMINDSFGAIYFFGNAGAVGGPEALKVRAYHGWTLLSRVEVEDEASSLAFLRVRSLMILYMMA